MFKEIDPFLEDQRKKSRIALVFYVIAGLIKLPFFLIFFTLGFLQFIIASFIPIPLISLLITRFYSLTFIPLCLFLFGEFNIPIVPTALSENYFDREDVPKPRAGDIIISNSISYISLFWFQREFSPLFVIPVSNTGTVVIHSFYTLFLYMLGGKPPRTGNKIPMEKAINKAKRMSVPIVIFPEGTNTNGKCLIKFFDFCAKYDLSSSHFHIFCVSHRNSYISPFLVKMDPSLHLLLMLGRFSSSLKINTALPQDVPQYGPNFVSDCRALMGTILRIPLVNVSSSDKTKNS